MGSSTAEVLRQQLREKFPQAHGVRPVPTPLAEPGKPFSRESFPAGGLSEVVPSGPTAGIQLLVAGLLRDSGGDRSHPEMVLVDGADAFDPSSLPGDACSKLLWVRCSSALEMIKAADLLIHDGNVPFVLLDATGMARRDLATVPAAAWWRIKQTAERNGGRVVVLSPFSFVPCAGVRLHVSADLSLSDFDLPRELVIERLKTMPEAMRRAT
jgi:hypothetical protein